MHQVQGKSSTHSYSPVSVDEEAGEQPERPAPQGYRWWLVFVGAFVAGVILFAVFDSIRSLHLPTLPARSSRPSPATSPPVRLHYVGEPSINERPPIHDCPVPVIYTLDFNAADAVVYNSDKNSGAGVDHIQAKRDRPCQSTVIWGGESAPNREVLYGHYERLREGKQNETYAWSSLSGAAEPNTRRLAQFRPRYDVSTQRNGPGCLCVRFSRSNMSQELK